MLKTVLARLNLSWFWSLIASSFSREPWQNRIFPQQRWLAKQVKLIKPNRILEVGCGFGRNLNYLICHGFEPAKLTGVDFSQRMLNQSSVPVKLVRARAEKLPFEDDCYDLVFTHGLLMHLPPQTIKAAVKELVRVSSQEVIMIEEVRARPKQLNFFTWAHNYDKIIRSLPVRIIIKKSGPHNLVWYRLKK